MQFDWNRARAFLVAAEEGSFSAAARALSTTQPTVGRQVAALEEELGVTLFARVGKRLELTVAGLELVSHVRQMGEAANQVSLRAHGQATSIEGEVTITASEVISTFLLPPVVAHLRRAHPGIELEIVASNETRDLRRREADIAVRNARPQQDDLVARKVRDGVGHLYGTPGYVASLPGPLDTREDLHRATILAFDRGTRFSAGIAQMGIQPLPPRFPIVTAHHLVQWALCLEGAGLCFMMRDVGDRDPRVQRVVPDLAVPVPLWLVSHRELRTSRKIRLVFDVLAEALAEEGTGALARLGSPP